MSKTIAIIGGGFCGTLTAIHLLRSAGTPLKLVLINRSGLLARGVAYGTRTEAHVLNVPAGRMGAFPDDEEDFLRFARRHDPLAVSGTFAPRRLYGQYLEWLLEEALKNKPALTTFEHRIGHVVDIEMSISQQALLRLDDGSRIEADRVVLALGNFAPSDPPVVDRSFYSDNAVYVRDPWLPGALETVAFDKPVLLIGTGLTAVDIAIDLTRRGLCQPVLALSRRGLAPLAHRGLAEVAHRAPLPESLFSQPATARFYLRTLRRHVAALAAQGIDWRDAIAALRPVTPSLWQRLSQRERARFLRHVQAYWEIFRHRLAPDLAQQFAALQDSGQLRIRAGRIQGFERRDEWIDVIFRPRGSQTSASVTVGTVINCTGPNSNMERLQEPLLVALSRRGWLQADTLGLGVAVTDNYALVDATGKSSDWIYYVGPFLKAHYWEATAVPELRRHVRDLVASVLRSIGGQMIDPSHTRFIG